MEARKKRLKGTHRATREALLPAAQAPQKRLTAVEFSVETHFSAPCYTTKEESERASSPDFRSQDSRSPNLIGQNGSLMSPGAPRKAGLRRACPTGTSSPDTKPTDGLCWRLARRRNRGVPCRREKETLNFGEAWTLSKCSREEAGPSASLLRLSPAVIHARSAPQGPTDFHQMLRGRRMKHWRASKVEASFILPIPPVDCDKRERHINQGSKVPVLPRNVYSTTVLPDRVYVLLIPYEVAATEAVQVTCKSGLS